MTLFLETCNIGLGILILKHNGRTLGRAWIADNDVTKTICLDYTMAAARVLSHQRKVAADNSTNFRFVYLSGGAVERDQDKPLWFMQDYRRIRVSLSLVTTMKEPFFLE